MSKDNTQKISVFSILIFIACGLLAIYTIASLVGTYSYIHEMLEYQQITVKDNFFDIVSYYVTSCGMYVVYIAILLSIWWISDKKKVARKVVVTQVASSETPEIAKEAAAEKTIDKADTKKDEAADKTPEEPKK